MSKVVHAVWVGRRMWESGGLFYGYFRRAFLIFKDFLWLFYGCSIHYPQYVVDTPLITPSNLCWLYFL